MTGKLKLVRYAITKCPHCAKLTDPYEERCENCGKKI